MTHPAPAPETPPPPPGPRHGQQLQVQPDNPSGGPVDPMVPDAPQPGA